MGKLKEYKYVILIAIVILVGAFYWYEWRPSSIRKHCSRSVYEAIRETGADSSGYEKVYKICLSKYGIK